MWQIRAIMEICVLSIAFLVKHECDKCEAVVITEYTLAEVCEIARVVNKTCPASFLRDAPSYPGFTYRHNYFATFFCQAVYFIASIFILIAYTQLLKIFMAMG